MKVEFSIQLSEDPENSVSLLLKIEIFTDHHLRHQERATANDLATAAEQIPKGQVWWRSWWLQGPGVFSPCSTWPKHKLGCKIHLKPTNFDTPLEDPLQHRPLRHWTFHNLWVGSVDWKWLEIILFLMTKDLWIIVIPVNFYCNYADLFSFPAYPLGSRESSWWTQFIYMRPTSSRQTYDQVIISPRLVVFF